MSLAVENNFAALVHCTPGVPKLIKCIGSLFPVMRHVVLSVLMELLISLTRGLILQTVSLKKNVRLTFSQN